MRAARWAALAAVAFLTSACATTASRPTSSAPTPAATPAEPEKAATPAPEKADSKCPVEAKTIEDFLARNQGRDGGTPETALLANSIKEEYRYMEWVSCGKDGSWVLVQQSLMQTDAGPVDHMQMRCSDGGEERSFYFDISAFFGKFECYDYGKG